MRPIRMDMSRDECRKCLRCLELDAYGNMVSVLRAQGPFTEDKKRLLAELAKVLHISNERHRAEVRRAVNDEKLSVIAEQLNGPNTWTDWAIEGRRTIPLLPRLEGHTAFTGLANSLSLVIAAANEKKVPINERRTSINERHEESIVKAATESCKEANAEEKPVKSSIPNSQGNRRGRKRKRSPSETSEVARTEKLHTNKKTNYDGVNSINSERQTSLSPRPINSQKESETPEDSTETSRCFNETLMRNSITCTVSPDVTSRNDSTNSSTCPTNAIPQAEITAIEAKSNIHVHSNIEQRLASEMVQLETAEPSKTNERSELKSDSVINDDANSIIPESTPSSPLIIETNRISSPALDEFTVLIDTSQVIPQCTKNTDSTGPGPPETIPSSPIHNNLSVEKFNHQSMRTMEITLNSNKPVNNSDLLNARLDSKTNAIIVQTETEREVELSHAEEEVLAKVITSDNDLCVPIKSATESVTSLPHEPDVNHCDHVVVENTEENSDHSKMNELSSKLDEMVVLEIQQDVSDETYSPLIVYEDSTTLNSDIKTALSNMGAHSFVEVPSEDCLVSSPAHHVDIILEENNVSDEESQHSGDISTNGNMNFESPSKVIEEAVCDEIFIASEQEIEPHNVLGAQTEIYNFESIDDNVCEIQIEETPTDMDMVTASLTSTDTNLEGFTYVENEEETVSIPEDEKMQITTLEELNELSDS